MPDADWTKPAAALFERFAERHSLRFEVDEQAPIELCWNFPVQSGISLPITLGLQNNDELNFGVGNLFWSFFFPFEAVAPDFETMLDAWVAGDVRISLLRGGTRLLQRRHGEDWTTIYTSYGLLGRLFEGRPKAFVFNTPV